MTRHVQKERAGDTRRNRRGLAAAGLLAALGLAIVAPVSVARAEIQLFWSTTGISDPNFVFSTALTNFLPYFVPPTPVTELPEGSYPLFLWGRFVENNDPNSPDFLPANTQLFGLDLKWEGDATHNLSAAYRHNKTGTDPYRRWDGSQGIALTGVMAAVTVRGVEFILPPADNNDLYVPNTREFLLGAAQITGYEGQSVILSLDAASRGLGIGMRYIGGAEISDPIVVSAEAVFIAPPGACCFSGGACELLTFPDCTTAGGVYQGSSTCASNPCLPPPGGILVWGDNTWDQYLVPAPNADFTGVAGGAYHCLGLKSNSSIIAWGRNDYGQCNVPSPNTDFVTVAAGAYHSLGLKADASIAAWGYNYYGQCNVPTPNAGFAQVAGGGSHSLALKADGWIATWGNNAYGQCNVPAPNGGFVAVAAGYYHSLGLKWDGSLVAWGANDYGQCDVPLPNTGFVAVAAGWWHSLGLKADGSIVAWGDNGSGQCDVPQPNTGFVSLAGGGWHSLAVKTDSTARAWGRNDEGQCDVLTGDIGYMAVAAGRGHSLGLRRYGACCFGSGACTEMSESDCAVAGGTYQGHLIFCTPANPCPQPTGACCVSYAGDCQILTELDCSLAAGRFRGVGTACTGSEVCGCKGDCNCDGIVDFGDVTPLADALGGVPPCSFYNCDVDDNGIVNFDDINPFVDLLSQGAGCP